MAEILVKAVDATNPNPETDKGCYKRGMPVVVMPDGHRWGADEGPPKFFILKLPGVPVEQVQALINEEREEYFDEETSEILSRMTRRREWKVDVDSLPSAVRSKLSSIGEITVDAKGDLQTKDASWSTFRFYVRKISTGEAAPVRIDDLTPPSQPLERN